MASKDDLSGRKLHLGILSAAEIAKKNVRGISKNLKGVGESSENWQSW